MISSITHYKKRITFTLMLGLLLNFIPAFAETTDSHDKQGHHADKSLDWPGIYMGFLPCQDCIGVKTTLALNKSGSYILITVNVGKSDREFVEKGKFTAGGKGDTLVLTARNSNVTHQYAVAKDMLIQLDEQGNRVSGKLADRYILRRKDTTDSGPSEHSGHAMP